MKILANFTKDGIAFQDAYKIQYEKYLSKKPKSFLAWIYLPGTQRTQKEHNAFWGDIGLVADKLKVKPEWVYWKTRNDPDFLRDIFEVDEYNDDGKLVGQRIRGLSEIDHEDMVNENIISRFRECWQDEIDQHEADKLGIFDSLNPVHVKMDWYSLE